MGGGNDGGTTAERGDPEPAHTTRFVPSRPAWLNRLRNRVIVVPAGTTVWKVTVAVLGAVIVLIGLALVPLPGPGWAIVFLGLAVWATEFVWAYRLLGHGQRLLRGWTDWVRRQSRPIQVAIGLAGLVFLACVLYAAWLLVW